MSKYIITLFAINVMLGVSISYWIYFYNPYINIFLGILCGWFGLLCYLKDLFLFKNKALIGIIIFGLLFWVIWFIVYDLIWHIEISVIITLFILTGLYWYFTRKNQPFIIKRMLILFLSLPLIFLLIRNIIYISPIWYKIFSYQDDLIYTKCIDKVCVRIYSMKTGFFFWDNFIQVSKYPLNLPFLDFPVQELTFANKNFELTKNNNSYFLSTEDMKGKISVLKID